MAVDMDEYMFSTNYDSVWHFLLYQRNLTHPSNASNIITTNFYAPAVRFGTAGLTSDFKGGIDADWRTSRVVAHFDLWNGSIPMLTAANSLRAPHPGKGGGKGETLSKWWDHVQPPSD